MKHLSRRTLLRGSGVVMALPLLDVMTPVHGSQVADRDAEPKRRMVALNMELSFHPPNLIPEKAGKDYELTRYLKPLDGMKDDFTVISGTSHADVDGGHAASKSWLTGAPHPGAANFTNSISIDQLAAKQIGLQTRFAHMAMGGSISVSANGVNVPGSPYPTHFFQKMFVEGRPNEKAEQIQKLREGQSVLDAVSRAATRMRARVSQNDQYKLDQYFTSVREAEQQLHKSEQWEHRPKPKVDGKPPSPVRDPSQIVPKSKQLYDVMYLALQTDSTRLITHSVSDGSHVPVLPGVSMTYHNLSHHGQDPEKLEQLALVEAFHVKAFGDFLARLKETEEGESNLLDQTMVMLGSHMHSGGHNNRNLPVVFAGGGFRHGQHLAFDSDNNYPLANLYVTMLQRLGLEVDSFASSTGTMTGLELA